MSDHPKSDSPPRRFSSSTLYHGLGLAPMVRASTTPLRCLALEYGADFVYTEELIDRALIETTRIVNPELQTVDYLKKMTASKKNLSNSPRPVLLRIDPQTERGKLICQIGTGDAHSALLAAQHVSQDVDAFDINMGCPKKFSTSGGMGSALLNDPERASSIIRTLAQNLHHHPVSAKIRLLHDNTATIDFITALIEAGANAVAIHGRTVGQEATEAAKWDRLETVVPLIKAKYPNVPILVNGDFYTRQEIMQFQKKTAADGVLLGRPALYNTSIFRKPTALAVNRPSSNVCEQNDDDDPSLWDYKSPLLLDKTTVVRDYLRHALRYDTHFKNVKYVICEFMSNRRTPVERVSLQPLHFPGNQTIGQVCDCKSLEQICTLWDVKYTSAYKSEHNGTNDVPVQAPSGEHRFEDSYFLSDQTTSSSSSTRKTQANKASLDEAHPTKRSRVDVRNNE